MKKVIIYTDGACSGNPGPGGWGCILIYNEKRKELSGAERNTTNNRMEITAAIMGLKALKESCEVELYTDSAYLCRAFTEHWIERWQNNGWMTSNKKPVENRDLWNELLELVSVHQVSFHKVKGHAANENNNRCDALATSAARSIRD